MNKNYTQGNMLVIGLVVAAIIGIALIIWAIMRPEGETVTIGTLATSTSQTASVYNAINAGRTNFEGVTNERLGFSVALPLAVIIENNIQSPLAIFDKGSGDDIYIAPLYYLDTTTGERTENTFERLDGEEYTPSPTWKITIKDIEDEDALADFVEDYFGDSCAVGLSVKSGESSDLVIYNVEIKNKDASERNGCVIPYAYIMKHSPDKKKIAVSSSFMFI